MTKHDRILVACGDVDKEVRFSHVVSTSRGSYVVFAETPFSEDSCCHVYRLDNVAEDSHEEDMVFDAWVEMTEAVCGEAGFGIFTDAED